MPGDRWPVEHDHGTGRHVHILPADDRIGWPGLLALGVSGGLLPCPSALVVLLTAISLGRVRFGLLLLVAFSVGLAGVLMGIGLLLVLIRGRWVPVLLGGRIGPALPVASAAAVCLLGMVLVLQGLAATGLLAR